MTSRSAPPPSETSPDVVHLARAMAHHQAGRLEEAAGGYRLVLQRNPGHFDATHLLGVIALQQGEIAAAERLVLQALAGRPRDAGALNNLGTIHLRAGRLEDARTRFEHALAAQPAHVDALANLGNVLRRLGRPADAVALLARASAAHPDSAEIALLLGASLLETGDSLAATTVFEASVERDPEDAGAWTHLSIASQAAGKPQRALEAADQALRLRPRDARALGMRIQALDSLGHRDAVREAFETAARLAPGDAATQHNFGVFLRRQGELDAAISRLRDALALAPDFAPARQALVAGLVEAGRGDEAMEEALAFARAWPSHAGAFATLASVHYAQERIEEAVDVYRQAATATDADASAFFGFGKALAARDDMGEAAKAFTRAIELDPHDARPRFALAMSHLRATYDDAGQMDPSRRAFTRAVAELDAWCTPARASAAARAVGSAQPFYLAYHPVDARPLLAPYGKLAARLMAGGVELPRPAAASPLAPLRARRIRIGIAAAHVRNHSVWNAITQGWVRHIDRDRFELFVFQLERKSDDETARARRDAAHFIDAPAHLDGWVRAIVDAEPDVLVYPEIGMHPLTTRLAALRLAPVQATSWGQPLTSGLPTMDLFLSGASLEPPHGADHYVERLVTLPNLGVCVQALDPVTVAPDLAQLGLPATEPLLLCPGAPFKYTPQADATWAAIAAQLQARGRGRLVFFRNRRAGMSAQVEQRMRRAFVCAGVDFDRTVAWIPTLERGHFFGLMRHATAMLDTIGFSGFNTALQGLACSLPVVAFEGEFMRGRLASGPLRQLGLDELVATTPAQFVEIAMRLVDDDALRTRLKADIAARRSALFGDLAPVRALEDALRAAVEARAG